MMPAFIGLGGHLRSGKDTVADRLVAEHGFTKLGMSDALHEAMLALDPIIAYRHVATGRFPLRYSDSISDIGYVSTKKEHPEVRRLLQKLGTEVGRDMIGENTWVDIIARKVDALLKDGRDVAVTGIRFPNELRMVRSLGGTAVWVDRPGLDSASPAAHASETSVDDSMFDRMLVNDGTLEHLYAITDNLVRSHP